MKGLLIKDFKLMKNNMKNSLLMIVFIAVGISAYTSDITFVITYLTIIGTTFTTSTLSYDEFDNGYTFLLSLPITRRGYIVEKYIFGLCMIGVGWLIGTIVDIAAGITRQIMMPAEMILTALTLLPVGFLILALLIPFHLKFGGDKGRIVMIGALGLLFFLITVGAAVMKSMDIHLDAIGNAMGKHLSVLGEGTVIAALYGIGIVLLLLSCRISMGIMEKKEF